MAKWYRRNIGLANAVFIAGINALVGLLSILSLAGQKQVRAWREHPWQFLLSRVQVLMTLSLVLTATLAGLNVLYNVIYNLQTPRPWHSNVYPVIMWCLLGTLAVSIAGTLVLLTA